MVKKIRTYSTEFKAEAVKKISDNNGNISATAKQLGIAMQTLSNWHNKANQGKLVGTEQYDPDLMTALQEIMTPAVKSVHINLGDFNYAA